MNEQTTEKVARLGLPLRCPGCGEDMVEVESDGVLIDVCSGCNALWLDRGELEQLGGKLPSHGGVQVEKKRRCPRCQFRMDQRDAHVVKVDICWGCGGLFLDSAAYETLVAAAGGRQPAPDDDATPATGMPAFPEPSQPASNAAAPAPASAATTAPPAPAISPAAPDQRFWCDLCHQPFPVSEQQVGERLTACPACAQRHGIKHDPKARRKAERQNARLNKSEDDLDPATLISHALSYLLGR